MSGLRREGYVSKQSTSVRYGDGGRRFYFFCRSRVVDGPNLSPSWLPILPLLFTFHDIYIRVIQSSR